MDMGKKEGPQAVPCGEEQFRGADAAVTLIAADTGFPEQEVRRVVLDIFTTGSKEEQTKFAQACAKINYALNNTRKLTNEQRRRLLRIIAGLLVARNILTLRLLRRWIRRQEPGSAMLFIARLFFTERKIERDFKQIVADYREEFNAAKSENLWKLTIVCAQHWHGFFKACGLDKVLDLLAFLSKFR